MLTTEQDRALQRIGTPLAIAKTIGKQAFGFEVKVLPHMRKIEEVVVEAVLDERQRFIIVTMPPRHGKTMTLGRMLPLWFLGWFPDLQVIYATYGEDFAKKTGRWVRDSFDHFGPELFGMRVSQRDQAAHDWTVHGHQGGMVSVGRGGPITGRPGHLILGDDLYKNPAEANSASLRKDIVEWYDEVLRTRLEPGGTIILFFTRWRLDDLIGTLIERSQEDGYAGDQWEVYNFPAIAEAPGYLTAEEQAAWTDIIGRIDGEALWPQRFDIETLERIRANTPDTFHALYQGDPRPRSGGWFPPSRWRYAEMDELVGRVERKARLWDLAATEGGGDWTTGGLCARLDSDDEMAVLEVQRVRESGDKVLERVIRVAHEDGPGVPIYIEEERQGSGKALLAIYRAKLPGFDVRPMRPEGKKDERAKPYNTLQNAGKIWLPRGAEWVKGWIDEHSSFMKSTHDDQVDIGSYAVRELVALGVPFELVTSQFEGAQWQAEQAALMERYGGSGLMIYG